MPKPFIFKPGVRYTLEQDGEKPVGYEVLEVLEHGGILVRNIKDPIKLKEVHHTKALRTCLWDGTLKFGLPGKANLKQEAEVPLKTSYDFAALNDLPDVIQKITEQRFLLIEPLLDLAPRERTEDFVNRRIITFLNELLEARKRGAITVIFGDHIGKGKGPRKPGTFEAPTPMKVEERCCPVDEGNQEDADTDSLPALPTISYRTACRWIKRYEESRGDIRSLVPSYHRNGPQKMYTPPRVQEVIKEAIKKVYKEDSDAPITEVIAEVKTLVKQKNDGKPPGKQLRCPSKRTIYRFIAHLDPEEARELGMGHTHRGPSNDAPKQGPRPTRPNERWEFDFTRLDLLVVDAFDRLPIGRPVIAAIRDKYTGYPVAIIISFEPPSYRLVMECLMYAILEKSHVKDLFHTENDYLAYGVPETLVVDNGLELHRDLEQACLQLGIELVHTKVRSPWLKGSIERWFKTLNIDLIHRMPGTTFSNFLQRGDYPSEKHACMTLDGLWEVLHLWIVDKYTQDEHRGIGPRWATKSIPAKLWKDALEKDFVPALPASRDELLVLVSRTVARKIEHYGVEFENLVYQGTELQALRYEMEKPEADKRLKWKGPQGKVQVKYYPGDLSRVWLLNPFSLQYIEIKAVDQEYTRGLSLWKHLVIKRFVREELKCALNEDSLLRARKRIQEIVREEFRMTRKIRSRHGAARWFDYQVISWMGAASSNAVHGSSSNEPMSRDAAPLEDAEDEEEDAVSSYPETGESGGFTADEGGSEGDGPPSSRDQIENSSAEEEGRSFAAEGVSTMMSIPPPPRVSGISLLEDEGTTEDTIPITQLPPMPEQPPPSKRKNRPKKQDNRERRDESPVQERPAETASNQPSTLGIQVSYARPLAHELPGGEK